MNHSRPSRAAAVLALLSPLAAVAAELPRGVDEIGTAGWSFDANLADSIEDDKERLKLILGFADFIAGKTCSGGDAELAHCSDSLYSFLRDFLDGDSTLKEPKQVFVSAKDGRVLLNRFNEEGGVNQFIGKYQPTLTGLPDRSGPGARTTGLTVYVARLDALPPPKNAAYKVYQQYVGDRWLDDLKTDHSSNASAINALVGGIEIVETVTARRRGRNEDIDKKKDIAVKSMTVVYSQTSVLGDLANSMVRGAGPILPEPFRDLPCDRKDLSSEFPDPEPRNQGTIGSCHVFAAVALLENGLRRTYGLDVELSDQDLFDQYKDLTEGAANELPVYKIYRALGGKKLTDGGLTNADLLLAKLGGVATLKTVPYLGRWNDRRGKSTPSGIGAERGTVKTSIAPFTIGNRVYTPLDAGFSQKYDIIEQLCAGRPVAVGMNIRGLKGFRPPKNESSLETTLNAEGHAFAVVGFEARTKGANPKFVFKTRNSWGAGGNHEVDETDLWRLNFLAWIETKRTADVPAGLKALAR